MRRHHGHGQGRVETTISFFFFEGSIFFSSSVFALFAALFGDNNLVCFFVFVFFFPSLKLGRFGALGA